MDSLFPFQLIKNFKLPEGCGKIISGHDITIYLLFLALHNSKYTWKDIKKHPHGISLFKQLRDKGLRREITKWFPQLKAWRR